MRLPSRSLAFALASIAAANSAHAHQSHSLEADSFEARAESVEERRKAEQRVRWRDERWKYDPVVNVKLLAINDFHGQLSPRTVGPRPAGGAAVLASYLQAAAATAKEGDIDLTISRRSGDVVEKSAAIVTTYGDAGPGLSPDSGVAAFVAAADAEVAPRVNRVVGVASAAITRGENAAGESALGNLIADAQRVATNAHFSFMNPGGIRADLPAGEVTWGELFTIQPFANDLVSMDLTGAQIDTLLEQQWAGQTSPRILKTSGLTYSWDASRPVGDRVISIVDQNNVPLDPAATYRVTVNSFIAAGGDNFVVLNEGTNRVVGPVDLDALVDYV